MKLYIGGPTERQESKDLLLKIRDAIPQGFEVLNQDLEVDLYKAEQADAIFWRMDQADDSSWAVAGVAKAGKRPIIPIWNASYAPKNLYGFQKDVQETNKKFIRKNSDREWPSKDIDGLIEDLKILEQNPDWRGIRKQKPGKENVNLNLPLYIIGDSRCLENAWAFYETKKRFEECGILCHIPPEVLDGSYDIRDYPKRIDMTKGTVDDCADYASTKSSFLIGRADQKNLLGSRFEEGVGWFESKPILYKYQYLFPPRREFDKYLDRKDPSMHFSSVYRQNEELWKIRVHEDLTEEELAGVIIRARYMNNGKN